LTSASSQGYRLLVVGVDLQDAQVAALPLRHGDDPTALLAMHGWQVQRVRAVKHCPGDKKVLTLTFVVEPALVGSQPVTASTTGGRQDGGGDLTNAVISEGTAIFRHQRVAAYAVVSSSRGYLMTQFSDRTGAPGQWGLPGGGLEPDEAPERAVVREVWEESGQLIEVGELALIATSRWVGRAPGGRLEDYHAVRVVYRAICAQPTQPVVHDVGGTTESAAWLPQADLDLLALTSGWRSILREVALQNGSGVSTSAPFMAPDQADGPDHHHQDADADEGSRSET
jgi:8-oxo-dGTP pyrophosphatase MutT (NUDIX family)